MNQNYSHSLAPKYSILLDPSGRMNIQQTILTVTTTINSYKVQIKTLIQTERKFLPRMVRIKFYVFYVTKYMLGLQVGVTTFFTFQYATERLIYCIGCEFGLCPFYPFPLSSIVPGLVWSTSLTIASLSSIGTLSRHQSPDDPSPIQSRTSSS